MRAPLALCGAAANKVAQDWIGEGGRQWLAVREQCRFQRNGLEARQAITFACSVDIPIALQRHIGKDLIEIDPRRGCWCGYKRPKRDSDYELLRSPPGWEIPAFVRLIKSMPDCAHRLVILVSKNDQM